MSNSVHINTQVHIQNIERL